MLRQRYYLHGTKRGICKSRPLNLARGIPTISLIESITQVTQLDNYTWSCAADLFELRFRLLKQQFIKLSRKGKFRREINLNVTSWIAGYVNFTKDEIRFNIFHMLNQTKFLRGWKLKFLAWNAVKVYNTKFYSHYSWKNAWNAYFNKW